MGTVVNRSRLIVDGEKIHERSNDVGGEPVKWMKTMDSQRISVLKNWGRDSYQKTHPSYLCLSNPELLYLLLNLIIQHSRWSHLQLLGFLPPSLILFPYNPCVLTLGTPFVYRISRYLLIDFFFRIKNTNGTRIWFLQNTSVVMSSRPFLVVDPRPSHDFGRTTWEGRKGVYDFKLSDPSTPYPFPRRRIQVKL